MHTGRPGVQEGEGRPMASWASIFLDYLDLKGHLLAVESKEAIDHLTGILLLLTVVVVVAVSSVLMYGAFPLFLIALLFHLCPGLERIDLRRDPNRFGNNRFLSSADVTSKTDGFN